MISSGSLLCLHLELGPLVEADTKKRVNGFYKRTTNVISLCLKYLRPSLSTSTRLR